MRKSALVLFLLLAVVMLAAPAFADLPETPISADSVRMVTTDIAAGLKKSHLVLWKQYHYPQFGYQAVVDIDSIRYTVYVTSATGLPNPDSTKLDFISIWSRRQGTTSRQGLYAWSDDGIDGTVDWASYGQKPLDFKPGTDYHNASQDMFQWRHNLAIRRLLIFFQRK